MRTWLAFLGGLSLAALVAATTTPRVSRVSLAAMEDSLDRKLERIDIDDRFVLLGATRGVYLDGFGAVFTTEVDLLSSAAVTPFRPAYTKEEIARLRQKKLARIEALKKNMRDMLLSSAASLDGVATAEQIALAVTIPYFRWEDSAGMPRQILMQAPKRLLLEAARGNAAALEGSLKVQEF